MATLEEPQNVTMPEGDDALVIALAGGKSQSAAAEIAGVCRDTVYRRMQVPAFRARIDAVRRGWIERASGHLADGAVSAVVRLRQIVEDDNASSKDHIAAARAILDRLDDLKTSGECEVCKRRAEEAANPKPLTLEEMSARDRETIRAYEALQAELAEARRLNEEERAKDLEGVVIPNVLCYSDGETDDRNGAA